MLKKLIAKLPFDLFEFLAKKKSSWVFAALGLLLVSVSLFSGLQFDDYVHRLKIQDPDQFLCYKNPITGLFGFSDGNVQHNEERIRAGEVPWWTFNGGHIAFFRPLAAMTHWIDYRLWPNKPVLMHIQSLLWFGAMILTASLVYRRMLDPLWIAGLAVLLFAVDYTHGVPAGWLANRNAVIAAVFGFTALYFHDRWRKEGIQKGAVLAALFFGLSLLSAEAGLAIGAYLFSYQVFLVSGSWRKKAAGFLPYVFIAGIWWTIYHAMGYGTFGSGAYVDPGQTPLAYLKVLGARIPLLLFGQWLSPDISFFSYLPKPTADGVLFIIYLSIIWVAIFMLPLIKRDAVARFWVTGMLLALLPACATSPNDRLLIFAGLGAMGLLAQFLAFWFEKAVWLPKSRIWGILSIVFVFQMVLLHLIAAPVLLPLKSLTMEFFAEETIEKPLIKLSQSIDFPKKILVFVNPPVAFSISFIPFFCEKYGIKEPEKAYLLVSGTAPHIAIQRLDAVTLEVEPENGFITNNMDLLFRGPNFPMHIGQKVDAGVMHAQVLTLTQDNRPLRVRFTFSRPLEDESLAFFSWQGDQFVPFRLPEKGEAVTLTTPNIFEM